MANPTGKGGFTPGQSGNPGGRPKGLALLIRARTQEGAELVEFVYDIFRGKRKAKLELRLDAATWLADRGFGKPIQTTHIGGDEDAPPVPVKLYGRRSPDDWPGVKDAS